MSLTIHSSRVLVEGIPVPVKALSFRADCDLATGTIEVFVKSGDFSLEKLYNGPGWEKGPLTLVVEDQKFSLGIPEWGPGMLLARAGDNLTISWPFICYPEEVSNA